MADYNPSRKSGIQSYVNENRGRDAYGHIISTPVGKEGWPTQFEEDVRIIYDELMSVLLKKHKDYGPKNIADAPGGALNGLRVRIHDKIARINNLVDRHSDPMYESIEDSFKDLANYAIIALLVLRDKWDK